METAYSILACLQSLKVDEWDKLYGDDEKLLDIKDAAVLNKYLIAGMAMLSEKDTKAAGMVNYPVLLKGQLKMNEKFGQAVIFKSLFERQPVVGGKKVAE